MELVHGSGSTPARARAHLPPLVAVRRARGRRGRAGVVRATSVGDVPVVLVRDREDTLRAFLNVCRHRGSIVCEGAGTRETLQCPYHAWTYGLDGRLITAPRGNREGGIDKDELGLVPLAARHLGAADLRQPGPGGRAARGLPRRHPGADRGRGYRPRRAALPAALGVRARVQLEGLRRELPRVLPLPDRPPGVLRRHGRDPRMRTCSRRAPAA